MSKKAKTQKSVPTIYQGLTKDPVHRHMVVTVDHENNISAFNNAHTLESLKSFESLIKPSIAYRWDGLDKFIENTNEQTILAWHEQLFGANPPEGQDKVTTAVLTWHKIIANAKTVMAPEVPVSASGRKSNLLNCKYFLGSTEDSGTIKTAQALACVRLFRAAIKDQPFITEGALRQYIIDNAGELHTRQDPWRIFQYYRPLLIKEKILRRTMED